MKALITGGTGFIGSSPARRLLDDGCDVRVFPLIARDAEGANARALERAGAEVVHHLAARMREANPPDRVFWETNLQATEHLATRGRDRGVRRFVYRSTMGVTGGARAIRIDEGTPRCARVFGMSVVANGSVEGQWT